VTSKLQVTIPKALADRFGISPGDEIEWQAAGEAIRIAPAGRPQQGSSTDARLRAFDRATVRRDERQGKSLQARARSRGWTREQLYGRRTRARSR
jgi:AbrB family looped-hinge helix DNA binding protein